MNKDIVWLDYARWLGIFLVVFGHTYQRFPSIMENQALKGIWDYIYLFHMPLFFVISGYLFNQKEIGLRAIKLGGGKLINVLVLPYLLYQLIYYPIACIQQHFTQDPSVIWKLLIGIILGDGYDSDLSISCCLPCWFIVSIIQLRIIFQVIPINKITSIIFIIACPTILVMLNIYGIDLHFCIDSTIMSIPYFIIGYHLRKNIKEHYSYNQLIIVGLVSSIIVWMVLRFNGAAQMNGPTYGHNIILNYVAGIAGTFLLFAISMIFESAYGKKTFVKTISRNTLFIIFFHWFLLAFISRVIYKISHIAFFDNSILDIALTIFISLVILQLSKIVVDLGMNKFPMIFGKIHK